MSKIKVCFVGCGGIANYHFSHLVNFDDVEFVGFCDLIPERAENMVNKAKMGQRYDSYVKMYDETSPDVVYVCVPPAEHGDIEFEAVKRGINIFVEKPVALSMELANQIKEAIEKAGVISGVGFQDRYLDVIETAKEFLKDRQVGLIFGSWVGGVPGVPWWKKYSTSGGQIVEQNIHLFDMLRYLIGEPEKVYCAAGRGIVTDIEGYDVHDYSSAVVTFKNGAIANLFTGCYTGGGPGINNGLTFVAKDARIEYNLRKSTKLITKNETIEKINSVDQGVTEDRTFIDAVKTKDQSMVRSPYADAVKTLQFTLACNKSIETGLEVII
jgi:myo-inositol 2-dehydrogenase / D-chiro-inositol 1-dehydrogenase